MPYRFVSFSKGQYYHVYNRGAARRDIFFTPQNYAYCLRLVNKYKKTYDMSIIAYCLMPNHYHFLLRQDSEISISKFMSVLFNAYVKAVNIQQDRKGTLFEGRFCHVHIDRDSYLIHLCRYIHLNPKKAGLVNHVENWPYSNYLEWIGLRDGMLVDREFIKDQLFTPETYIAFVNDDQEERASVGYIQRYTWD